MKKLFTLVTPMMMVMCMPMCRMCLTCDAHVPIDSPFNIMAVNYA